MATVLYLQQAAAVSIAPSVTRYMQLAANSRYSDDTTTEAAAQITYRSGGVFSNLYINILTNTITATSTFRTRNNGANAAMVVSITASTTGKFEDTSNTDTVTAGDEWNYIFTTGATGTAITFRIISCLFAATTNTVTRLGRDNASAADLGTSATTPGPICGDGTFVLSGTESNYALYFRTAGTLANMFIDISANGRSTTSTLVSRINGATGNLSIAITAAATGLFEDTANSDSVALDNYVNLAFVSGTGTGTMTVDSIATDFTTTNGNFMFHAVAQSGQVVNAGVTTYYPLAGALRTSTTESEMQAEANLIMATSLMQVNLTANTVVESSLFRLRKNTANGNQVVTCTGLTTGVFQDTTNSDSLVATDIVDYSLVTGATGTSLTVRSVSLLADSTVAGGSTWVGYQSPFGWN